MVAAVHEAVRDVAGHRQVAGDQLGTQLRAVAGGPRAAGRTRANSGARWAYSFSARTGASTASACAAGIRQRLLRYGRGDWMHPGHRHGERAAVDVITGAQNPPVDELRDGARGGAPVGSGRSSDVDEAQTHQELGRDRPVVDRRAARPHPARAGRRCRLARVADRRRGGPDRPGRTRGRADRHRSGPATCSTVFASVPVPRELDDLQIRLGTGPCLTAARKQIVVRMHDIAADTRWSEFCRAAKQCDVGSMLCVPLFVDDQMLGTLSFYGEQPDVFRDGAEPIAALLATLSAVALADSFQRERIERALRNRDVIGQAKGILMSSHGVPADTAFEMLRPTRSAPTASWSPSPSGWWRRGCSTGSSRPRERTGDVSRRRSAAGAGARPPPAAAGRSPPSRSRRPPAPRGRRTARSTARAA